MASFGANAVIRAARADEADQLAAVVDAAYRPYVARIGRKPAPMLDDYAARIARNEAWVLERDGIAGVLILEGTEDGLLIDNIAVRPGEQGQGLGRAMMAFAEAEAVKRGYHMIRLFTNAAMVENIARYLRWGFAETGRRIDDGFARVYMAKRLDRGTQRR